jgi:glucose-6-phosphate 1-epimerase
MPNLDDLNARFGIPNLLSFDEGEGGLPFVRIRSDRGAADLSLYGAHVTYFKPVGVEHPVLWMSPEAVFAEGKAIRGGIPICWPWFGNHPSGSPEKPAHGVARIRLWEVRESRVDDAGRVRLKLELPRKESDLSLSLEVLVGAALELRLTTGNKGDAPVALTAALHTYFAVSEIGNVRIKGLDGVDYWDQLDGNAVKRQEGDLVIDREVDRIYVGTEGECRIVDGGWERVIRVAREGSGSVVVWNPWIEKSERLGDFPDEGYPGMLCIEAANAGEDVVTVQPGRKHVLGTTISVTP